MSVITSVTLFWLPATTAAIPVTHRLGARNGSVEKERRPDSNLLPSEVYPSPTKHHAENVVVGEREKTTEEFTAKRYFVGRGSETS